MIHYISRRFSSELCLSASMLSSWISSDLMQLQWKTVKIVPYQLLSAICDLVSKSFTKKTDGKTMKYIVMVKVCIKKFTMLLSCPNIKIPKIITKTPSDSANQAMNVIWMFNTLLRCLFAFVESVKSFVNAVIDFFSSL